MQAGGSSVPTSVANIDLQLDLEVSRGSKTLTFTAYIRMQLVLMQAAGSNASASVAYIKTQLDLDASRRSNTLISIA